MKRLLVVLLALVLVFSLAVIGSPSPVLAATFTEVEGQVPEAAELLQFTAGGHVLGFQPDGIYVVGGDHMLRVEFQNTAGVAPLANQPPANNDQALPLGQVTYPHLWDGISLTYEPVAGGIARSSYVVDPGAAVDQIRLRYNVPLWLDEGGNLLFDFEMGQMSESAPMAWQEIAGERASVEVAFLLLAEREVGFALGEYNAAYPLMIDPTLQWHTFMGSAAWDGGNGIAVYGSDVYVTGHSEATWGAPLNPYGEGSDAFVAKLDNSGALQWHTFMGSSSQYDGGGIAVDGSGVYVTGWSDVTWGTPLNPYAGGGDAFVAKLDNSGALQWHTFMGAAGTEYGSGIAVDGSGVYVTGLSYAAWGVPLNPHAGDSDAFVAKLDSSGALQWHSFMGSPSGDCGNGIAVDGSGVYVTGDSSATWGTPLNPYAGGGDAFVAKLDSSGALQWHTFMGSADFNIGSGIAVDGSGVYVTGSSNGTWGAPLNPYAGGFYIDAFVARLNSSGALQWHTFMGSVDFDDGYGIAVDGSGVYITGHSTATWGAPLNPHAGGSDAFVAKIYDPPPPPSPIIGGTVFEENMLEVMMPWLGVVGLIVLVTGVVLLARRRINR